jgi:hypothetical protein
MFTRYFIYYRQTFVIIRLSRVGFILSIAVACIAVLCVAFSNGSAGAADAPATGPASMNKNRPAELWGKEIQHFQMSLSVPSLNVSAVEPLIATVTIKNNATEQQGFWWVGLRPHVRDSSGVEVAKTRYGLAAVEVKLPDLAVARWGPGESKTFYVVVSRECDMTTQGDYSISVSTPVTRDQKNPPTLESNTVKVHISDFEPSTTESAKTRK